MATNGYNGDGLRAWKQTGSGRTYYIYDGDQVIGEFASGTSYLSALNTWGANGLLARHTRAGSQRRGSDKRQIRQGQAGSHTSLPYSLLKLSRLNPLEPPCSLESDEPIAQTRFPKEQLGNKMRLGIVM